jgi:phage terminase large subunit GpA-like protein
MVLKFPKKCKLFTGCTGVEGMLIPDFILPSTWLENNFFLVKGYAQPGKTFKLRPWQTPIVDAIVDYSEVIICLPPQVGKSLLAEGILWYIAANRPVNSLCVYAKKETVEDVFNDRFKPAIEQVPALRALWSGNSDDLTMEKLTLKKSIIRIASAGIREDIASHPSGHVYLSEVAKYKDKGFSPIKLGKGRQEAYTLTGNKSTVLESSPLEKGDPLHTEMYKPDVLNLEFFWPCPVCGYYQIYETKQIKELPNGRKEMDHDVLRIRTEGAARYECVHCGNDVPEDSRVENHRRGVWAALDEVIGADGKIVSSRKKTKKVSFRAGRLIDHSVTFAEYLARFFEGSRSSNINDFKDFKNEDEAEFWDSKMEERPTSWLLAKCKPYKMSDPTIPAGVVAVFAGLDTQDKGFYFVLRGWGLRKESWLLDCDYIPCDKEEDQAYEQVLDKVRERIFRKKMITVDGRELPISFAFWDRGGHRPAEVDYCTSRINFFFPIHGDSKHMKELYRAKDTHYLVNTESLSHIVGRDADLDNWHLPEDVPQTYLNQFVKHYDREKVDRLGNHTTEWVSGGEDHLRDCEAYCMGAMMASGISEILENGEQIEYIKAAQVDVEQHANGGGKCVGPLDGLDLHGPRWR